jgi:hypothetical protein
VELSERRGTATAGRAIYLHKRSRLSFCVPSQLTPACRENPFALATRSSPGSGRFSGRIVANYDQKISIQHHFIPVYGNTNKRVIEGWKERGGIPAYKKFIVGVAADFDHVTISDKFWDADCQPFSSASVHMFAKAIETLIQDEQIENTKQRSGRILYDEILWQLRDRYFSKAINIGLLQQQMNIAEEFSLPCDAILERLHNGQAMAAMCNDNELKEKYKVEGSPTYVMNEGRQKLYGNVGYKIIAANIDELLNRPQGIASWC